MISAFPAVQIVTSDSAVNPQMTMIAQTQGIGLQCTNGVIFNQDMTLLPASSGIQLAFPNGASAAVFIYVFALNISDLIIKTGSGLVAMPVLPFGQGQLFYGLTVSQISLNSVLGGRVQYAVGG